VRGLFLDEGRDGPCDARCARILVVRIQVQKVSVWLESKCGKCQCG
jgi:hypothetical protein